MMKRKRSSVFFLWVLSVVVVMPLHAFAAAPSKCSGNGVVKGAALQNKIQNGRCDQARDGVPVPEPSGLALLAGGVIAVYMKQLRKSKKMQ